MRIEVLVGSDEPLIFPLKANRVSLGNSEINDIVINSSGISRKHLLIISEDDKYFVVDQGSTNGTFVNEERLVPGRRVEFTSFFPLRLGDDVLVSLLSDDEMTQDLLKEVSSPRIILPKSELNHDSTRIISLKELKKVKTEKLIATRDKKRANSKPKVQKKRKHHFQVIPVTAFMIVVAAAYYTIFLKKEIVADQIQEVGKVIKVEPVVPSKKVNLIPESDLIQRDSFNSYVSDIKCTSDLEAYLCGLLKLSLYPEGVVQKGLSFNVLVNISPLKNEAYTYLNLKKEDAKEEDNELVNKVAVVIYLLKYVPDVDLEKLKYGKLFFHFFEEENGVNELKQIVAIYPEELNNLHKDTDMNLLLRLKQGAAARLEFTKDYYQIY